MNCGLSPSNDVPSFFKRVAAQYQTREHQIIQNDAELSDGRKQTRISWFPSKPVIHNCCWRQSKRTSARRDPLQREMNKTMGAMQHIRCSLCNVPFCCPNKVPDAGSGENDLALSREWITELRFIAKNITITECSPILLIKTQSLESPLERTSQGSDEFLTYRLPDLEPDVIGEVHEGRYSIYTGKGEEQQAPPHFPIHYECIELLQVLKTAYKLTQDDIWRVLTEGLRERPQKVDEPEYKYLLSNPTTIHTLTQYILSLLQPISPDHHHHQHPHHKYHQRSPSPEFSSSVCYANYDRHHIFTDTDTHLQQEQREYRDKLLSGEAIPYIWDLDIGECMEKDRGDQVWDWKGLAEDLARLLDAQGISDNNAMFWEKAPLGLRNRCRIWYNFRQRLDKLGVDVAASAV